MTVCIATMCEGGSRVVAATDGGLTLGGVSADILVPGKMLWFNDWLFLWAGEPGNIDLVLENIRQVARIDKTRLAREKIQVTVRSAFKAFVADWSVDYVLPSYNMSIEEFKDKGQEIFGRQKAAAYADKMDYGVTAYLLDQLLVVGWGKMKNSARLYEIAATRRASHALAGSAAIGSGAEIALSTLMMLGQSRDSSLEDTIYAVAAAKFMAENSEPEDSVRKSTAMFITHKRTPQDEPHKPAGYFIEEDDVKAVRALWEEHGRPRIPVEALPPIMDIIKRLGVRDHAGHPEHLTRLMRLASRTKAGQQ